MNKDLINIVEVDTICKAWVAPDPSNDVVSIGIAFKGCGEIFNPNISKQHKPSHQNLLALMMSEGTTQLDHIAFKRFLISKKIELSAYSSNDHFFITVRCLKSNLDSVFQIIKSCMCDLRLDQNDFTKIKSQMISSIAQSAHFPDVVASQKFAETAFGESHFSARSTEQTIKDLNEATTNDLRELCKKIFTKKRMFIVAAGGISSSDLKDLSLKYFSDLESGDSFDISKKDLNNLGKTIFFDEDIPQKIIYFYQKGLSSNHEDYPVLVTISEILGGGMESRLFKTARDSHGLVYGCYSYLNNSCEFNLFMGSAGSRDKDAVVKIIKDEVEKLYEKGVNQEELDFHVNQIVGSHVLNFSSTKKIVNVLLSGIINNRTIKHVQDLESRYKSITKERINECIKKYINPSDLAFVVYGS